MNTQQLASENISKIFNPNNAYKRKQQEILDAVFGNSNSYKREVQTKQRRNTK